MSIRQLLDQATEYLDYHGIEESRLDAQVLCSHVLKVTRSELLAHLDDPVQRYQGQELDRLLARRVNREPIAYITGHKEFYGLNFLVTPDTLIPRPETELLVETVLQMTRSGAEVGDVAVDVGTGCGAIAVTLAVYLPEARLYATDISSTALEIARKNAIRHRVSHRMDFVQGDLLKPFRGRFALIVANLPYIADNQLMELEDDIKKHEPHRSLTGGSAGLDIIGRLLENAGDFLNPEGAVLLEIGYQQGEAVKEIAMQYFGDKHIEIIRDIRMNDRVVAII